MPQTFEVKEQISSLFTGKCQKKQLNLRIFFTFPSAYWHNTKLITAITSLDNKHIISSLITHISDPAPQTFGETTFHPLQPDLYIIYFHRKNHK